MNEIVNWMNRNVRSCWMESGCVFFQCDWVFMAIVYQSQLNRILIWTQVGIHHNSHSFLRSKEFPLKNSTDGLQHQSLNKSHIVIVIFIFIVIFIQLIHHDQSNTRKSKWHVFWHCRPTLTEVSLSFEKIQFSEWRLIGFNSKP